MKKIVSVVSLLLCGLVVLLGTVDLEPYLAPDQPDIHENVSLQSGSTADGPPIETVTVPQVEMPSTVISASEQTFTQPEDVQKGDLLKNSAPAAQLNDVAIGTNSRQILSSLLELKITILPEDEYPFSILLETLLNREAAQKAIDSYQDLGVSAHSVKVNLGKNRIRYRVFTGVFSTEPEAEQYLNQNHLVGKLVRPTYYSARIGVYQDKAQLVNAFVKTRAAGVFPYILGTKKGDYHLYVGSFYTFIGATNKCNFLFEAGLNCEPVKRSTLPQQ